MEINGSRIPQPALTPASPKVGQNAPSAARDTFRPSIGRKIAQEWQNQPAVRAETVERARQAVARGEYDSRQSIEKLAGRLAAEWFGPERRGE
jgi:hypothetical protein